MAEKRKMVYGSFATLINFNTDPKTQLALAKYQFIYSALGLFLGFSSIIGGIALFFNGIFGSISWSAKIIGAESKLVDATPGAALFIVGLFIVFITRYKFKHVDAK